jgi:CRP-like cAMP-binding protein
MKIMKLLKEHPLFCDVSEEELVQLAKLVKLKKYQPGQVVFNWGERGGNLYLIKQGRVEISLPLHTSHYGPQKVSILDAGSHFGELSFLDGKEHSARVTAITETELLVLSKRDYDKFIQQNLRRGVIIQNRIISSILDIVRLMNKRYSLRPFIEQFQPPC